MDKKTIELVEEARREAAQATAQNEDEVARVSTEAARAPAQNEDEVARVPTEAARAPAQNEDEVARVPTVVSLGRPMHVISHGPLLQIRMDSPGTYNFSVDLTIPTSGNRDPRSQQAVSSASTQEEPRNTGEE